MKFSLFIFYCSLNNLLALQIFLDNIANASTENGTSDYPFSALSTALTGFSDDSDPYLDIIILSNTYNYSLNSYFFLKKSVTIAFVSENSKAGIIFSSGCFELEAQSFN